MFLEEGSHGKGRKEGGGIEVGGGGVGGEVNGEEERLIIVSYV